MALHHDDRLHLLLRQPESDVRPSIHQGKEVQFGMVEINEHPIIIDCNPAVSSGIPIGIDWSRISQTTMSIDEYEMIRVPVRVTDHTMLLRSSFDRYDLLLNLGYTCKELRDAEKEVDTLRRLRQQTLYAHDNIDMYDDADNNNQNGLRKLDRRRSFLVYKIGIVSTFAWKEWRVRRRRRRCSSK